METVSTPHDGVDGVVFVVDDGKHRLGILTELGHMSHENNTPTLALDTHRKIVGSRMPLYVATRTDKAVSQRER